jgi:hypothetical protein
LIIISVIRAPAEIKSNNLESHTFFRPLKAILAITGPTMMTTRRRMYTRGGTSIRGSKEGTLKSLSIEKYGTGQKF